MAPSGAVRTLRGAPVVRKISASIDLSTLPERLLSVRDLAEKLSVSRATIYALVERGESRHTAAAFFLTLRYGRSSVSARRGQSLDSGNSMAADVIGRVKSGSNKSYEVKWDHASRDVYVAYAGWTACGKASSSAEAMRKAEAYLYDK